jgi:2-C-methyl-D-erythritol 2,4-cyclodiphosphate synthase
MQQFRVGFGYDVHPIIPNRPLWLGGINIPSSFGLKGHSDADVLIHAICDALLGAAGLPDIGFHFPDTQDTYLNIDSKILLQKTWSLVTAEGFQLGNMDCTLVAEAPKIQPFIGDMKNTLATILSCSTSQIGIKATTNEKIGFVGRQEGMCAYCVALLFT